MEKRKRYKSPRNFKARKYMEDCSRFEDLKKTYPGVGKNQESASFVPTRSSRVHDLIAPSPSENGGEVGPEIRRTGCRLFKKQVHPLVPAPSLCCLATAPSPPWQKCGKLSSGEGKVKGFWTAGYQA